VNLDALADVVAGACLVAGALLSLAAGVGLLRFPDLLSRMHSATKPQVLGLLLILTGAALRLQNTIDVTTLVLVGLFQLATAPVSAHMVGRAVYRAGHTRPDDLVVDELAGSSHDDEAVEPGRALRDALGVEDRKADADGDGGRDARTDPTRS
jgi:multicomponent Na+:H+ antiporter subunit G